MDPVPPITRTFMDTSRILDGMQVDRPYFQVIKEKFQRG